MAVKNVKQAIDTNYPALYTYPQVVQIANEAAEKAVQMAFEQLAIWQPAQLDNGIGTQDDSPSAQIITVEELAALLKVSKPTAYEFVRRKDFPSFRVGKSIRINKRCFEEWLSRQCLE